MKGLADSQKLETHVRRVGVSSDEDGETCPICLNTFTDQPVGTPENCSHFFCLDCIVEWSKVSCFVPDVTWPSGVLCSLPSDHAVMRTVIFIFACLSFFTQTWVTALFGRTHVCEVWICFSCTRSDLFCSLKAAMS